MKPISGNFCYLTNIGQVRMTNEDQAYALTNSKGKVMLLVCDGMGGQNRGDLASRLATAILSEEFKKYPKFSNKNIERMWIRNSIKKANTEIFSESYKNPKYKGMGTTLTAVLISHNHLTIAQMGDSRAYILLDGKLEQITEDQTYVGFLYRTGQITKEEMLTHPKRHILSNALGINPAIDVDIKTIKYAHEPLLLCSDGLYNNVSFTDMEAILKTDETPDQKCASLISLANANGGSDNIAIVYWEVIE
ncbi:MAG: Stp1/IreP family PP2C-type Ser/Thr phosphatase [Bacilli bacterium]|jgi:protein phosphatase|nr:Stp1/IreP family PP2C-type Ser/Thr phosphatase [Bacilli bacterium]